MYLALWLLAMSAFPESNGMDSSSPQRHLSARLVIDSTSKRKGGRSGAAKTSEMKGRSSSGCVNCCDQRATPDRTITESKYLSVARVFEICVREFQRIAVFLHGPLKVLVKSVFR